MSKTETQSQSAPVKLDEMLALADRAQKGDKTALPGLELLITDPAFVDAMGGDLAKEAQLTLIKKYSGKNLLFREAVTRKLNELRADLVGPSPTPIEGLLVERIVACWLHLHHMESIYVQKESMAMELAGYYQRSITSAQKRYLAAIKTLVLVRKLAVPVLQVNIARKQLNVGHRA